MNPNDFVAEQADKKRYPMRIGHNIASSLSGFIAGAIVASIIWFAVSYVVNLH